MKNDQSVREATIRECIAALPKVLLKAGIPYSSSLYNKALADVRKNLEALLPKPVDPLLIEAREVAAKCWEDKGCPMAAKDVRAGRDDDDTSVKAAYAALKSREAK